MMTSLVTVMTPSPTFPVTETTFTVFSRSTPCERFIKQRLDLVNVTMTLRDFLFSMIVSMTTATVWNNGLYDTETDFFNREDDTMWIIVKA